MLKTYSLENYNAVINEFGVRQLVWVDIYFIKN